MNFNLVIPDDVYQKIMWWINKSEHEVSGFGSLLYDAENDTFTVKDAILLKQEVGPTSTEIDPVALGKAMYEMRAEEHGLKWHWHSHVNMGVFWSSDDMQLIESLGQKGWIVATVFNKKHEMKTAIQLQVEALGFIHDQFIDNIPTKVTRFLDKTLCEVWDKEYADKVAVEKPKVFDYESKYGQQAWSGLEDWKSWSTHGKGKKDKDVKDITDGEKGFVQKSDRVAPRYITAESQHTNYDRTGWRYSFKHQRPVYNPVFDKALKDDEEIIWEIMTMDDADVESAMNYWGDKEHKFDELYDKAVELAARYNIEDATTDDWKYTEEGAQ